MNNCQVTYDVGMLVPITAVDAVGNTLTAPGANKAAGDIVQLSTDGDPRRRRPRPARAGRLSPSGPPTTS
jgi:hypothetical protein